MAWSIGLIDNTVEISPECAAELFQASEDSGHDIWSEPEYVTEDGALSFNSDHYEHMDYVNNAFVLEILARHKVNGDITFGSLDGDNAGSFWGYRFVDGVMTTLTGSVVFQVDA